MTSEVSWGPREELENLYTPQMLKGVNLSGTLKSII